MQHLLYSHAALQQQLEGLQQEVQALQVPAVEQRLQ
jgi:hypothetical protein